MTESSSHRVVGGDFVAVVRLSTKKDDTLALPGERCTKVPVTSLGWLERKGAIRRAPPPAPRPARTATLRREAGN